MPAAPAADEVFANAHDFFSNRLSRTPTQERSAGVCQPLSNGLAPIIALIVSRRERPAPEHIFVARQGIPQVFCATADANNASVRTGTWAFADRRPLALREAGTMREMRVHKGLAA
jgi:hypothetical protein